MVAKRWSALLLLLAAAGGALYAYTSLSKSEGNIPPDSALQRRTRLALLSPEGKPFEGFLFGIPLDFNPDSASIFAANAEAAAASRRLREKLLSQRAPADLADLAVLEMLVGSFDHAVSLLEEARRLAPGDPALSSDLAAAYLARAESGNESVLDKMRALAAATRSLELKPDWREGLCNKALALDKLYLREPAWHSWTQCWDRTSNGPFGLERLRRHVEEDFRARRNSDQKLQREIRAAEVSGRWRDIARAVVDRPEVAREIGEEYLDRWARSLVVGRTDEAGQFLLVVREIGNGLARSQKDPFFRDVVSGLSQDPAPSRAALAQGFVDTGLGASRLSRTLHLPAVAPLRAARKALEQAGSPYALRTSYLLALSLGYTGDRDRALELLRQVEQSARSRGYRNLLAESLWMIGLFESDGGRPTIALTALREALQTYQQAGDWDGVAGAHNMIAELLDDLGATEEAWEHRQTALELLDRVESPKRRYQIFIITARAAAREGMPEVAVELQNQAVAISSALGEVAQSEALFWRSRFFGRAGDAVTALRDIEAAQRLAQSAPDPSSRDRAESDLLLARAEDLLKREPAAALAVIDESIARSREINHRAHLLEAILLKARACRSLGDSIGRRSALAAALDLVEAQRDEIKDLDFRMSYMGVVTEVYDEMILAEVEEGRPLEALSALERKRARTLFERLAATSAINDADSAGSLAAVPVASWASFLPARTLLISYARIESRLFIWGVSHDGLEFFYDLVWSSAGDDLIQRLLDATGGTNIPAEEVGRVCERLFDLLIKPIASNLPAGYTLVFSRDDLLGQIPFSLLRDRATGHYLIENYTLSEAPSGRSLSLSLRSPWRDTTGEAAAFYGNPSFDEAKFRLLSRLPGAKTEASSAASLYPGAPLRLGEEATRAAFLADLSRSSLVQFSGHAVADRREPLRSALLLAPAEHDDGTLRAFEIYQQKFPGLRLVILSACGSATGPASRSEGVKSLAHAFYAAGADSVLGTRWDVEDRAGQDFIATFHSMLKAGASPAEALQSTQIAFIESRLASQRSPLVWASFEVTGGLSWGRG
jgi:CHAT domain-containing protein/tetratricopeptide (TPR) repeat protein